MTRTPHTTPTAILSFLLLIHPHAARADVGDAMDFVSYSAGITHLCWLLLMYVMIRRYSNVAQLLGLCAGALVTTGTCIVSFLLGFSAPAFMLAGFAAAALLGAYAAKGVARGWDARKNNKPNGEHA